jgi:transposase InsO family protein
MQGRPPGRLRHSWEARCRLVRLMLSGLSPQAASRACGMSRATAYRLLRRYQRDGWDGLRDRPPIAKHCPHRLSAQAEAQIVALRRQTGWGPRSLSAALGWPASTIWRVLVRHGLSRAERQPRPAANRYEHARPGELVHLDAKKLGRFWQVGKHVLGGKRRNANAGWQHAHVAVDDHSRWAMVELRPAEDAASCTSFLESVISAYREHDITIHRVITDNGAGYRSRRFRALLDSHGIRHIRTKPYTPRTNGKAEAFIRILQREWAYAYIYPSSTHRARALPGWVRWYNHHRPHGSLDGHPPITRVSHAAGSYT